MSEKVEGWLGFEIEDDWFETFQAGMLTKPFCEWWVGYYGKPEEYRDEDEYYVRMAFALRGWLARKGELKDE